MKGNALSVGTAPLRNFDPQNLYKTLNTPKVVPPGLSDVEWWYRSGNRGMSAKAAHSESLSCTLVLTSNPDPVCMRVLKISCRRANLSNERSIRVRPPCLFPPLGIKLPVDDLERFELNTPGKPFGLEENRLCITSDYSQSKTIGNNNAHGMMRQTRMLWLVALSCYLSPKSVPKLYQKHGWVATAEPGTNHTA